MGWSKFCVRQNELPIEDKIHPESVNPKGENVLKIE